MNEKKSNGATSTTGHSKPGKAGMVRELLPGRWCVHGMD